MNESNDRDQDRDEVKDANGDGLASTIYSYLKDSGVTHGEGDFLGLGAGFAFAERGLAGRLGIDDSSITLVDNEAEDLDGFRGTYKEEDMFKFMEGDHNNYGVITAIGFEYLLHKRDNAARLWSGISRLTQKGSVVVVYPYEKTIAVDENVFNIITNENKFFIAQRIA